MLKMSQGEMKNAERAEMCTNFTLMKVFKKLHILSSIKGKRVKVIEVVDVVNT